MEWISALFDNLPPRAELEAQCPELVGKFVLLFFARVHVKKGLDLLAEALSRVCARHPEIHLVIAGNDDGALSPFRDRMAELGLTRRMTYLGHVSGERAAPGLGRGRRLYPAQLQRRIQHGHSRGHGLPAAVPDHDRLPLPGSGRRWRGRRCHPDSAAVTQGCASSGTDRATSVLGSVRMPAGSSRLTTPGTARQSGLQRLRLAFRRRAAAGACHPLKSTRRDSPVYDPTSRGRSCKPIFKRPPPLDPGRRSLHPAPAKHRSA